MKFYQVAIGLLMLRSLYLVSDEIQHSPNGFIWLVAWIVLWGVVWHVIRLFVGDKAKGTGE